MVEYAKSPIHNIPSDDLFFMYSVLYAKLITIGKGVKENAIAQDKRDKGVSVKIDACIICLLIT